MSWSTNCLLLICLRFRKHFFTLQESSMNRAELEWQLTAQNLLLCLQHKSCFNKLLFKRWYDTLWLNQHIMLMQKDWRDTYFWKTLSLNFKHGLLKRKQKLFSWGKINHTVDRTHLTLFWQHAPTGFSAQFKQQNNYEPQNN